MMDLDRPERILDQIEALSLSSGASASESSRSWPESRKGSPEPVFTKPRPRGSVKPQRTSMICQNLPRASKLRFQHQH